MEPRQLFSLALKIIGIFFIKNVLEAFSRLLSVLVYLPQYTTEDEGFFNLGVTIPPLVLYTLFSWALIFRTDSLISLLRLDHGSGRFSPEIQLTRRTVLITAILVISGWMLITEIPEAFRHAVYYVQERRIYARMVRPDISYMIMAAFKVFFALFLMLFNRPIVNLIERYALRKKS